MGLLSIMPLLPALVATMILIIPTGAVPVNTVLEISAMADSVMQTPFPVGSALTSIIYGNFIVVGTTKTLLYNTFKRRAVFGIFLLFLTWVISYSVHDVDNGQELWLLCIPFIILECFQLVSILVQLGRPGPVNEYTGLGDDAACLGCLKTPCICGAAGGTKDLV